MSPIGHFMSNKSWSGTSDWMGKISNPATGAVTGQVSLASRADVDAVRMINGHDNGNGTAIFTRGGDAARDFRARARTGAEFNFTSGKDI